MYGFKIKNLDNLKKKKIVIIVITIYKKKIKEFLKKSQAGEM